VDEAEVADFGLDEGGGDDEGAEARVCASSRSCAARCAVSACSRAAASNGSTSSAVDDDARILVLPTFFVLRALRTLAALPRVVAADADVADDFGFDDVDSIAARCLSSSDSLDHASSGVANADSTGVAAVAVAGVDDDAAPVAA